MKLKIIMLLERGFDLQTISKLTGYKMPTIYYYNKLYKKEKEELQKILSEQIKKGEGVKDEINENK